MDVDSKTHESLLLPLIVHEVNDMDWADGADLLVVAYGDAGDVTALQARELGGCAAPWFSTSSANPPGRDYSGDEHDADRL